MWNCYTEHDTERTRQVEGVIDRPPDTAGRQTQRLATHQNRIANTLGIALIVLGVVLLIGNPVWAWTFGARVIASGDYTLARGEALRSNLLMTSGRVTIEEGARITGSVVMTSGKLCVEGEIAGNVFMTSGHISIGPRGAIHGGVSKTSGRVERADGPCGQG